MNIQSQLLLAWCGIGCTVLWLVGWGGLAGFIPPPSPSDTALQVQAMYMENTASIRAGLVITMFGGALTAPFFAAISTQMKRMEGPNSPLATAQSMMGAALPVMFILPCMFLLTAAFRPERNPELTQLMNDAGFLPFVGAFYTMFFQCIVIAIAIFRDDKLHIFPRWLAFLNLFLALSFFPDMLIFMLKDGAFAWDGLIAFWVVLVIFVAWFLAMFYCLRKAIIKEQQDSTLPNRY